MVEVKPNLGLGVGVLKGDALVPVDYLGQRRDCEAGVSPAAPLALLPNDRVPQSGIHPTRLYNIM